MPDWPRAAHAGIDRARMAAFAGILAGLNAVSPNLIAAYVQQGLVVAFVSLGGISAGVWFALAGCYMIAREPGPAEAATRADCAVCAAIMLAAVLPIPELSSAAVLAGGLWFALTSGLLHGGSLQNRGLRIGVVLIAASGTLIVGKLMLTLFAPSILPLDGALVAAIAGTASHANTVAFADGKTFVIGAGCSSIHNLTFALLVWGTLTQVLALRITARLFLFGIGAMAATVAINVCRLVAIALMPQHFDYLHTGEGAAIIGWITLLVGGGIVFAGAYGEKRPAL